MIGVDSLDEAVALRRGGIGMPILILYWTDPSAAPLMARHRMEVTVWDAGWIAAALEALVTAPDDAASPLRLHLHVDTGLGRAGCLPEDAVGLAAMVASASPHLHLAGLSTHFCCVDDAAAVQRQFLTLQEVSAGVSALGLLERPLVHAAGSAAAVLYPHTQADMVRIGGLLYGILPGAKGVSERLVALAAVPRRALRWLSLLTQVKRLPEGWCVGYACSVRAPPGGGLVGLLPLGTQDGLQAPSASSSAFRHVLVRGQQCAVLWVDANVAVVDLGMAPQARVGDEVTLLGCEGPACLAPALSTRIPAHLLRAFLPPSRGT